MFSNSGSSFENILCRPSKGIFHLYSFVVSFSSSSSCPFHVAALTMHLIFFLPTYYYYIVFFCSLSFSIHWSTINFSFLFLSLLLFLSISFKSLRLCVCVWLCFVIYNHKHFAHNQVSFAALQLFRIQKTQARNFILGRKQFSFVLIGISSIF